MQYERRLIGRITLNPSISPQFPRLVGNLGVADTPAVRQWAGTSFSVEALHHA